MFLVRLSMSLDKQEGGKRWEGEKRGRKKGRTGLQSLVVPLELCRFALYL